MRFVEETPLSRKIVAVDPAVPVVEGAICTLLMV